MLYYSTLTPIDIKILMLWDIDTKLCNKLIFCFENLSVCTLDGAESIPTTVVKQETTVFAEFLILLQTFL